MILTLMVLVLVSQCMMVFLSYLESFFPTIFRKILRNSVGAFPLRICPSGFLDFTIASVPLHHNRVFDPDVPPIKSGKDLQNQIWDPGIFNFGFEALSRFPYSIPENEGTASSNTMLYTATEGSNFMSLLTCISVRDKLPMVPKKCTEQGNESYSQCFVNNPIRRWLDVLLLHHPGLNINFQNDESEAEFYFLLHIDIALTSSRWPLDIMDWVLVYLGSKVDSMDATSDFKKSIWVIRQRRLHNDHSESLPKSSVILISTKRQDTVLSPTTSCSHFKIKVMLKAFWSLSSKLIANNEYVKEGHNRFHLLARKAFDSRVNSPLFHRNCFNFLYLRTMVVLYLSCTL